MPLPNQRPPKKQVFNDGLVRIASKQDVSEPGGIPEIVYVETVTLPFKQRTVGFQRRSDALNAGQSVDFLIECPEHRGVHANDVAQLTGRSIDGEDWYKIDSIDYIEDSEPRVMRLSLSKTSQRIELTEDDTI